MNLTLARDLIDKHFRRLSYFVHTHYLVIWLCTEMYSESISSWWLPGLILFNSNWQKSQRPKPATGLIGPMGKSNWLNLLFSPLKLVGEKNSKKDDKKTFVVSKQQKTCLKIILFKCRFSSTLCVGLSNIEFRNIYCRPNFQSIFCNLKQNEMAQKHIFCQHILLHLKVLNQLAFVLNKVMLPRRAGVPSKNISTIESSSPSF